MEVKIEGIKELKMAIRRNPEQVAKYSKEYIRKGLAAYMRTIRGTPWRVGANGGGAPVLTGNLRDSHLPPIYGTFEGEIRANNTGNADYATAVHKGRPWLDYAKEKNQSAIEKLQDNLLKDIVNDLSK